MREMRRRRHACVRRDEFVTRGGSWLHELFSDCAAGVLVSATVVRYRVAPGRADENAELVRGVYAELTATGPAGFHYATYVEDDGVSFVHIAVLDDDHDGPLPALPAFQRFQADIADRCDVSPVVTKLSERVGSYGL